MSRRDFHLTIVVPCYNEQDNLAELHRRLSVVVAGLPKVTFLFVDDGSTDETHARLRELEARDARLRSIRLSRNFGHQNALKAGLDHAPGDVVISMDADLQHPPELITTLLERWHAGFDVVQTVRAEDPRLPWSKRMTSRVFHVAARKLLSVDIPPGAADFRLLDRKVVDAIRSMEEDHLFLRGMVRWVGFEQTTVDYEPGSRFAGSTHYSWRRMFALAFSGITSFSVMPLRLAFAFGFVIAFLAGVYGCYVIGIHLFTDRAVAGWTSTTASVLFIGGIQLIMLGIVGEYLGKAFMQSKRRPNYLIRERSI